jgi:hypothetical protein
MGESGRWLAGGAGDAGFGEIERNEFQVDAVAGGEIGQGVGGLMFSGVSEDDFSVGQGGVVGAVGEGLGDGADGADGSFAGHVGG